MKLCDWLACPWNLAIMAEAARADRLPLVYRVDLRPAGRRLRAVRVASVFDPWCARALRVGFGARTRLAQRRAVS